MSKARPGRPRARLFVALELPDQTALALSVWRSSVYGERPEFRLPDARMLHVTLVFLGYQYERDIERIAKLSFAEPPAQPFTLAASAVVKVPPGRARLHALEFDDPDSRLVGWQAEIASRLQQASLHEPEKRPFWPHVTIARGKRGRERETARAEVPELPARLGKRFQASQATLLRSQLRPSGAVYERLASIELK